MKVGDRLAQLLAEHGVPVVAVLFNDDTLGWVEHVEKKRFPDGDAGPALLVGG